MSLIRTVSLLFLFSSTTAWAQTTMFTIQDFAQLKFLEGRWQASELSAGKACFSPINAPGSFCWEQLSDTLVHVTQRWSDAQGKPQDL